MKTYWNLALGISFFTHSFFIAGPLGWFFYQSRPETLVKPKKEVTIIPQKVEEIIVEKQEPKKTISHSNSRGIYEIPPPYVENITDKLIGDAKVSVFDKPLIIEKQTKEIVISDFIDVEAFKKNPSHMGYYNSIRSKLHSVAQRRYKIKENGKVLLNFIISRDGRAGRIEVASDKQALGELVLGVVREASPFAPFPDEFKFSSFPVEIIIEFINK